MRVLVLTLLVVLSSYSPLLACLCESPLVSEALKSSDIVFSGIAGPSSEISLTRTSVAFSVNWVWKGAASDSVTISTHSQPGACGFQFVEGEHYLIYARSTDEGLYTDTCTRSRLLCEAQADVLLLPEPVSRNGELGMEEISAKDFIEKLLLKLENVSKGNTYSQLVDLIEFHNLLIPRLTQIARGHTGSRLDAQRLAIKVLGSYGYHSRPAIPALLDLLCSESSCLRVETSYSLQNIFPEGYAENPEVFFLKSLDVDSMCFSGVEELRRIELGALPPEGLREEGGRTGPMYFVIKKNPDSMGLDKEAGVTD